TCSDTTGLAAADIDAAAKSGLTVAAITLQHTDLGPLGVQDRADASSGRFDLNSLLSAFAPAAGPGIRQAFGTPPFGTCTVSPGTPSDPNDPFNLPSDPVFGQFLNVGQVLNLNGPQGAGQLTAPNYAFRAD